VVGFRFGLSSGHKSGGRKEKNMDWGSVADWVGALGGLLAVIAAVVSWQTSRNMEEIERNRDLEQQTTEERRQAELVSVVGVELSSREGVDKFGIMVVNGSTAPILEVEIHSQKLDHSSDNHVLSLGIVPPGKFVIPAHPKYHWGSVIDQETAQEPISLFTKGKGAGMITHVAFADASMKRWQLKDGRILEGPFDESIDGEH